MQHDLYQHHTAIQRGPDQHQTTKPGVQGHGQQPLQSCALQEEQQQRKQGQQIAQQARQRDQQQTQGQQDQAQPPPYTPLPEAHCHILPSCWMVGGIWGLGCCRSLRELEARCGVNFLEGSVGTQARTGGLPQSVFQGHWHHIDTALSNSSCNDAFFL